MAPPWGPGPISADVSPAEKRTGTRMDMKNWKCIPAVLAFAACVLAATDAAAWGPRAQSVASKTALRVIRRSYPDALNTKDRDYEPELLQGTAKGIELFQDAVKLRDSAAVDNVIGAEIQLLREARRYGTGSYFAFSNPRASSNHRGKRTNKMV